MLSVPTAKISPCGAVLTRLDGALPSSAERFLESGEVMDLLESDREGADRSKSSSLSNVVLSVESASIGSMAAAAFDDCG